MELSPLVIARLARLGYGRVASAPPALL